MSFVIDEAKVEELLKSSNPGYAVSIATIESTIENRTPYYGYMEASGTGIVGHGTIPIEARGHLMAARRKIEKAGTHLQSAAELTREIEGMRGGSR
jgi:hypothetical protein